MNTEVWTRCQEWFAATRLGVAFAVLSVSEGKKHDDRWWWHKDNEKTIFKKGGKMLCKECIRADQCSVVGMAA